MCTPTKPEYIDRNALYEQIRLTAHKSALGETTTPEISAKEILSIIADMPVADVAEITRCKNCNYYSGKYCTLTDDTEDRREPDDFCSCAEKRKNDLER